MRKAVGQASCLGSSVVEQGSEEPCVVSSILTPGTTKISSQGGIFVVSSLYTFLYFRYPSPVTSLRFTPPSTARRSERPIDASAEREPTSSSVVCRESELAGYSAVGSAPGLGPGGRGFEPLWPDQKYCNESCNIFCWDRARQKFGVRRGENAGAMCEHRRT